MNEDLNIIPIKEWGLFESNGLPFYLIAGPCSVESKEQLFITAKGLKEAGVNIIRAGVWKPRTYPGCFEGIGEPALQWIRDIKKELGLKFCIEVANKEHCKLALKYGIDMLWIGARSTANPFVIQEIGEELAGKDIPILVKNPIHQDLSSWIGALQRLNLLGINKLGVIHRGFSTIDRIIYRNNPGWQSLIELRSLYPQLPFFCDPSHIAGDRKFIYSLSQRAMDLGIDGLMIEVHHKPDEALSDAKQQLDIVGIKNLISRIRIRNKEGKEQVYIDKLKQIREEIDIVDESLLNLLAKRMQLSYEIGTYKKEYNIAILQTYRWDSLLNKILSKARHLNLNDNFIKSLYGTIHQESIQMQNEILQSETEE